MRLLLLLTCLGCVLPGCYFTRARVNTPDFYQRAEQILPGQTTTAEMRDILGGPPFQVIDLDDGGKMHVYVFGDSKTEVFNILIFAVGETNLGVDTALFLADPDGVIEEKVIGQNSADLPWDFWAFSDD